MPFPYLFFLHYYYITFGSVSQPFLKRFWKNFFKFTSFLFFIYILYHTWEKKSTIFFIFAIKFLLYFKFLSFLIFSIYIISNLGTKVNSFLLNFFNFFLLKILDFFQLLWYNIGWGDYRGDAKRSPITL